jgi:hypothetical protein
LFVISLFYTRLYNLSRGKNEKLSHLNAHSPMTGERLPTRRRRKESDGIIH